LIKCQTTENDGRYRLTLYIQLDPKVESVDLLKLLFAFLFVTRTGDRTTLERVSSMAKGSSQLL